MTDEKDTASGSFERKMKTLETLIAKLESGDVGLDESLKLYEQGAALLRDCRQTINDAEKKMDILMRNGDTPTLRSVEPPTT